MNLEALSKQYAEDGVVKVEALLSPAEIEEIREHLARYTDEIVPGLQPNDVVFEADGISVRNLWRMHVHDPWFEGLAKKDTILAMVADFVHGDPVLMAVESFNKPAKVGSGVPPHQDNAYFCLAPPDALTVWIAIDAVTEANGPVSYLRGSHLAGARPHKTSGVAGNSMGLAEAVDETVAWPGYLKPGDALVHHSNTIHFSAPNVSEHSRLGLLMVFKGAHCFVDESLRANYALAS